VENPKRKKPRRQRGEFHYNNGDYSGLLWCARVSELIMMIMIPLHTGRDLLFI